MKTKDKKVEISRHPVVKKPADYSAFFNELKVRIRASQIKAALSANKELILLYWDIGRRIVEQQRQKAWGSAFIESLAQDIEKEFPGIRGFSTSNIWRMRAFYLAYTEEVKILAQPARETSNAILAPPVRELDGLNLPPPVAEIPWAHNVIIIEKIKDPAERLWYAQETIEHGWSRAVLVHQIESGLYRRQGKAITNFDKTLPPSQSDLAQQAIKDPYIFDFLTMTDSAAERELEKGLIENIRKFLLELGVGFAFVGSQYHLEVEEEDFYIDLLFYHLHLRCFVVIDLKVEPFKPEFAGKMNFYLSAVDDMLRHPDDKPSIGIIICKTKKKLIAEYSLRNTKTPIGVSEYRLTASLPKELKGSLPTIKQLETELGKAGKNEMSAKAAL